MFIHNVYVDKGFHFSFVMSKDYMGGKQRFPLIFTAVGPISFVSCFREEGILVKYTHLGMGLLLCTNHLPLHQTVPSSRAETPSSRTVSRFKNVNYDTFTVSGQLGGTVQDCQR